jgi:hypothetical protein
MVVLAVKNLSGVAVVPEVSLEQISAPDSVVVLAVKNLSGVAVVPEVSLEQISAPDSVVVLAVKNLSGVAVVPEVSLEQISAPDSVEDMYQRLVHVTAISDNHFEEAQGMFSTVQCCLPQNKIIVYDLGLNKNHRSQLMLHENVELRSFPFSSYSHLPHVKNLRTYAWKPIIIKEVSLEYDTIMYGDASLRMVSCDIRKALTQLLYFPFFAAVPISHRAIEYTHGGMVEYLQFPKSRKDVAEVKTLAATAFLLLANSTIKEKLIDPWLDCALHEECIAPRGSALGPCQSTELHDGRYIGCHRYDQSALNLILVREFGQDYLKARHQRLANSLWEVRRS